MEQVDDLVYDVIIIGAGAAGSSAAYILKQKQKNLKILILEAKNRVGGRTQTIQINGTKNGKQVTLDAGGQWVTDAQKNVTKILKELNIETYNQYVEGKKIIEQNGKISDYNSSIPNISILSMIELGLNLTRLNSSASRVNMLHPFEDFNLANNLDSQNLEQLLFRNSFSSSARSIIIAAITTIFGLPLNQINALFAAMYVKSGGTIEKLSLAEPGCAQEKRVKGGTQQISQKLIDKVLENSKTKESTSRLLLNHAVLEIIQNENDENDIIKVKAQSTVLNEIVIFKAKRIISSIPPNLYANVKFTPELPIYKRNVFKFMTMGNLLKFVVTYETAFWREKGFSGEVISDGSILSLDENELNYENSRLKDYKTKPKIGPICLIFDATTSENEPALVGFIGADQLTEWTDHSVEARKKEVIKSLVRWFGEQANDYVEYFEKNWSEEKYSGGCPCVNVTAPGVMKDYVRATREPFLNVHFCGTESATEWQGYIDGAIESGIRAANECLYKMLDIKDLNIVDFKKTYYYQDKQLKNTIKKIDFFYYFKHFIQITFILAFVYILVRYYFGL